MKKLLILSSGETSTLSIKTCSQPPPNSFYKPLSDPRVEIQGSLADLGVLTKIDIEGIVENCLIQRTNSLQSQIVKADESPVDDASQIFDFTTNMVLESVMFNLVETRSGVLRSSGAPKVSEAEMCRFVRTKAVADKIVKPVLSKNCQTRDFLS